MNERTPTEAEMSSLVRDAMQAAIAAEEATQVRINAEARVLERAIAMLGAAGPTLRAVGTLPVLACAKALAPRGNDPNQLVLTRGDKRIICVGGMDAPDRKTYTRHGIVEEGFFHGTALWLDESAILHRASYAGPWRSEGDLDTYSWAAKTVEIDARAAVAEFRLDRAVQAIHRTLVEYLRGKTTRNTRAAHARAVRLNALLTLLEE